MKRGRPVKWDGPTTVTSCRIPSDLWQFVKRHKGMEFSALLAAKILETRQQEGMTLEARLVLYLRKYGLNDLQIAEVMRIAREGVPKAPPAELAAQSPP